MSELQRLLDIQALDTHADQLRHRRETLPERAVLAEHEGAIVELDGRIAETDGRRDALARDQRRIEDEVAGIEDKVAQVDRTLYKSGTITSPREAQTLSDELESLRKRQRVLEDEVLEVMERLEPVDAELAKLRSEHETHQAGAETTRRSLEQAESEVDAELEAVTAERATSAVGIHADHLDEYERLRHQLGGIGVAKLSAGTCGGCNLTLSAVERDRIKSEQSDAIIHCEECGRLLVR